MFLKNKLSGYLPKLSRIFSSEDVKTCLKTAPHEHHLDKKLKHFYIIFFFFQNIILTSQFIGLKKLVKKLRIL